MKAAEIQILKDEFDVELPKLEAAELSRLPADWQPMAGTIMSIFSPKLQAILDGAIAKIPVDPS